MTNMRYVLIILCFAFIFFTISAAESEYFIFKVEISKQGDTDSLSIIIPLKGGPYNIDWENDGIFDEITGNNIEYVEHTYSAEGVYTIAVDCSNATAPQIQYADSNDKDQLLEIQQWGSVKWASMQKAFQGCSNLTVTAADIPDLSNVNDMSYMFNKAYLFNSNIDNWDVSNVTDMSGMFWGCHSFSQDIGNWDVSSVTDMNYMFSDAKSFNQNLSNWDVSNVKNMSYMFLYANSFNGDISNWDVSSVTDMSYMFSDAALFNCDISNWDVSSVIDMSYMFFNATAFNADISRWDVSNVVNMVDMFAYESSFNCDIGNWNVSNVMNMSGMFFAATSFNQDIGNWDVSNVNDMNDFLTGVQLSTNNYDSLLINWSKLILQLDVSLDASKCCYSDAAEAARNNIISNFSWTINDNGLAPQYTVTAISNANGTVAPESQTVYYGNDAAEIIATGDDGYHFLKWNDGNTDNPRTLKNVIEDTTVSATFEVNPSTVTVTATADGNGTVTPEIQTIDYGNDAAEIIATPEQGYHFLKWDDGKIDNPRIFQNVTSDITITAIFEINPSTVTVTATSNGNGTVTPEIQTVDYGKDSAAISAVPAEHYHFVQWNDGNTDNPRIVKNATENITIIASFAIDTFTITANSAGKGIVSPQTQTVDYGNDSAEIIPTPDEGYHFLKWDDNNTENLRIFTNVTEDITITASFEIDKFTVTAGFVGSGMVAPEIQTIDYDCDSAEILAVPEEGYHFLRWNDGNTDNPRVISHVQENTEIIAIFAINTYTVTFETDGSVGALLDGEQVQTVDSGHNCSPVKAIPNQTLKFVNWTGSDGFVTDENPLLITDIHKDMLITANFETITQTLTVGNIITVYAANVPNLNEIFIKEPKLYGEFIPIGDFKSKCPRLTKVSKNLPSEKFQVVWRKSTYLYDKQALKDANKSGVLTSHWIQDNPMAHQVINLKVKTKNSYGNVIEEYLDKKELVPPVVTGIFKENGDEITDVINKGDIILIKGLYFGQKVPKVCLEYRDDFGKINQLKLSVLKPLLYSDAKGKPQKSCMNPLTGESQIKLEVLSSSKILPDDSNGVFDLILSNKLGIAIDKTTGKVPVIKVY